MPLHPVDTTIASIVGPYSLANESHTQATGFAPPHGRPTVTAPPLDWAQAKSVAAARLDENWASPETTKHAASANMAQELAVLLCAFGELAGEVGRHEARTHIVQRSTSRWWHDGFMGSA